MILAGMDEAGYGPMLGPFVVSVALFRVPDEWFRGGPASEADTDSGQESSGEASVDALAHPNLWRALGPLVVRKPQDGCLAVNDSKKLFQRRGLRNLEEGLLPFVLQRTETLPRSLRELLRCVARRGRSSGDAYLDAYPWYRGRDVRLPVDTFPGLLERQAARLRERCQAAGIECAGLAAAPVEVLEWNDGLEASDNKSMVAFDALGGFLRRLWRQFRDEPVHVVIDRQGGRTQYSRPLFSCVRPQGIRIDVQSQETSSYLLLRRGASAAPEFRVTFTKESEEKSLAVALASMLSKYLRELHMSAFNEYWSEEQKRHTPTDELRPTAGYVQDARRFLSDTETLRCRLGTDPALLIRRK